MYGFGDIAIFRFWQFGLKTPIHAPFWGFLGTFPPKNVTHRSNPQKDRPWVKARHLSHKAWLSAARFELGVVTRKKGQDSTGKKSQKGYISPIWAEAPTRAIYIKNCVVGDLLDVIKCAKFQNEIFRGYHFTGGRIFHLPIVNGPYNSAALLRCLWYSIGYYWQGPGDGTNRVKVGTWASAALASAANPSFCCVVDGLVLGLQTNFQTSTIVFYRTRDYPLH